MPRSRGKRKHRWFGLALKIAFVLFAAVITTGAGFAAGIVMGAIKTIPTLNKLNPSLSSAIYDAMGQEVTRIYGAENRIPASIDDLKKETINAFVAVEDERFWTHRGVDLIAIARALYNDLQNRPLQGASTITQQLARNAYPIGRERTIRRKVQEAVIALELERRYTKKEILEMYLNHIYFGRNAYGVEAAAETYFGKPAREMSLAESALLAGLPQAPNAYEPIGNPEAAKKRRNLVLDLMVRNGFVTSKQTEEAKKTPVKTVAATQKTGYPAAHFVDYVLAQLLRKYPKEQVYQGGLRVYTTLDVKIQKAAEEAVARHLKDYPIEPGKERLEAAVVILDQKTGGVRAMVGGREHHKARELNRAWFDPEANCCTRQPGSAFKPLAVYLPALEQGMTAATIIDDSPATWNTPQGPWSVSNYDRKYRGLTTVREAIRRSVNVAAVKVLDRIGSDTGYSYAARLGISTLVNAGTHNDRNLSLGLGGLTRGTSVLDMARAYAVIANGGMRVEPVVILKVVDTNGNVLEDNTTLKRAQVIKPPVAYLMTDILRSVVERPASAGWIENWGTGENAKVPDWPTAGKTGTTSDLKDVWFVGYTPKYTGAVWLGYDNPNPKKARSLPTTITSSKQPSWIWRDTMVTAHAGLKPVDFEKPSEELVRRKISVKSGKLAGPDTPPKWTRYELFVPGTQPRGVDNAWEKVLVCNENPEVLYHEFCGCTPLEKTFLKRPATPAALSPADEALAAPTASCLGTPPDDLPDELPDGAEPEEGEDGVTPGVGETTILQARIDSSSIDPAFMRTRLGSEVQLSVTSTDAEHELVIPDLGVRLQVPAGATVSTAFTPDKPGLFLVRCELHPGEMARLLVQP